jgi:hypothetical protein
MIRSTIIKPFLSVFATAVFVFSSVPKIVFHELFADHHYKSYYHIPDAHPHYDPPSASCDCVCSWFDQLYDNKLIIGAALAAPVLAADYSENLSSQFTIPEQLYGLRGPPVTKHT